MKFKNIGHKPETRIKTNTDEEKQENKQLKTYGKLTKNEEHVRKQGKRETSKKEKHWTAQKPRKPKLPGSKTMFCPVLVFLVLRFEAL